mmetsp:Transcript_95162/g.246393  ORF Transcript_95162/g.246393 Transcript_95162/m.246393 type:complete len:208 (+) Transcript_95162:149-772(+)
MPQIVLCLREEQTGAWNTHWNQVEHTHSTILVARHRQEPLPSIPASRAVPIPIILCDGSCQAHHTIKPIGSNIWPVLLHILDASVQLLPPLVVGLKKARGILNIPLCGNLEIASKGIQQREGRDEVIHLTLGLRTRDPHLHNPVSVVDVTHHLGADHVLDCGYEDGKPVDVKVVSTCETQELLVEVCWNGVLRHLLHARRHSCYFEP